MDNFYYFTKLQKLCVRAELQSQFGQAIAHLDHPEAEAKCQQVYLDMVQAYRQASDPALTPHELSQYLKGILADKLGI